LPSERGVGEIAQVENLGYRNCVHKHLRRLERVWVEPAIYFITTCTFRRRPILASDPIAKILVEEMTGARRRHGWAVGKYVIMPDHVHFFCAREQDAKQLSGFIREWKSWTSRRINALLPPRPATTATTMTTATAATAGIVAAAAGRGRRRMQTERHVHPPRPTTSATAAASALWQREYFDHLLRSDESYAQKWDYVRDNPVRAGPRDAR
jgi:putative transposase